MVNILKICSRIRSSFILNQNVFIYKRQIRKINNNLSLLNIDYMPITILNSKDYEFLWTKNIEKLNKENFNLNFNDFKKICFILNQTIDYSKNRNFGSKAKKLVNHIITSLFEDSNSNIAKSFIENPKNWSILFDLISDIEELFKNEILATKVIYDCPAKDFRIHSIDHILQSLKRFSSDYIFQLDMIQDYKIDLNLLKNHIDIIKSIHTYFLSNKTELTLEDEYAVLLVIKANLFYVESFLFKNKFTLKYLLSQKKDDTNNIVFDYLDQVDSLLSKFMKYYSNFGSISFPKKSDYLEAFSYFEKKWLNSCNWLLNTERSSMHNKEVILYKHCLKGSIHFERMDYFEKLFKSFHELIIDINLAEGFTIYTFNCLFRDFLNIQFIANNNANLENNLTILFNVWSHMSFCPNKAMLKNLQLYFDNLNKDKNNIDNKSNQFTDKNSKWLMKKVNVNLNGKVKDTDFILERASFNKEDINIISNLFKQKIINEVNLREDILKEFNKIDTLLETSKFDIIVDGMNVCYLRYHKEKFDNIFYLSNLINLNEKNKSILIFLRDHVFYRNIKSIKNICESNNKSNNRFEFFCINSLFEDDKFFLYSAFKCGINTYVVSNDHFKDQTHFLGNYGVIAREWMFNHMIKIDRYKNKLKYPPMYKLKCNQVNEKKWILACLLDNIDNKRDHSFVSIEKTDLN